MFASLGLNKFSWNTWLIAIRPRTLILSTIPVIAASSLAASTSPFQWHLSIFAALSSLFIQIGTNLVNDALDFQKGADTEKRIGPQRASATGLIPSHLVLQGGYISFLLALLFGIPLMVSGGWPLALFLFLSAFCGYLYTATSYSIAYNGFSELFVFLFFGIGATAAVFYLQTGFFTVEMLLMGAQIGLLSCVPLAINNFRDRTQDEKVNKNTLAVRFGDYFARCEITCFFITPFLLNLLWLIFNHPISALFPFVVLPLAYGIVKNIWKMEPSPIFNQFLAKSALANLIFSLLLSLSFWF